MSAFGTPQAAVERPDRGRKADVVRMARRSFPELEGHQLFCVSLASHLGHLINTGNPMRTLYEVSWRSAANAQSKQPAPTERGCSYGLVIARGLGQDDIDRED
jgi:hypothetical protein